MIAKRLPWKPEYATNAELFWSDLDKANKQYVAVEQPEEYIEPIEEEPCTIVAQPENDRRQYMKSLLGVD